MEILDEAKGTILRLVDVRNEQDRVAEEKIEAGRSMCYQSAVLVYLKLIACPSCHIMLAFFRGPRQQTRIHPSEKVRGHGELVLRHRRM